MEDKRRAVRVPVELHSQIKTGAQSISGTILNLSVDGAFVKCNQLLDAQESVTLIFSLPGRSQVLADGQVMWGGSIEGTDRTTYVMGIHFDPLNQADRDDIAAYIQDLMKH